MGQKLRGPVTASCQDLRFENPVILRKEEEQSRDENVEWATVWVWMPERCEVLYLRTREDECLRWERDKSVSPCSWLTQSLNRVDDAEPSPVPHFVCLQEIHSQRYQNHGTNWTHLCWAVCPDEMDPHTSSGRRTFYKSLRYW